MSQHEQAPTPPGIGTSVSVRMPDGHEFAAIVVESGPRLVRIAPSPSLPLDAEVDIAWDAPLGSGRARCSVPVAGSGGGGGVTLLLGPARPLDRRFFTRTPPLEAMRVEGLFRDLESGEELRFGGRVEDLSLGGVSFLCDEQLPDGAWLALTLRTTADDAVVAEVNAQVLRTGRDGGQYSVGCGFEHLWNAAVRLSQLVGGDEPEL